MLVSARFAQAAIARVRQWTTVQLASLSGSSG
jgi:hypothetical protein